MVIIEDCKCVVRVKLPISTLRAFLENEGQDAVEHLAALSKREGVVVCYKNKVRIKRLSGSGWYQISGYREDGSDTQHALSSLKEAHALAYMKGRASRSVK